VEIGVAEIVAAVEFVDLRDAALGRRIAPRIEDLPAHARLFHAQLAPGTVELAGTGVEILHAREERQDLVP